MRKLVLPALLVSISSIFFACGGGDDDPAAASPSASAGAGGSSAGAGGSSAGSSGSSAGSGGSSAGSSGSSAGAGGSSAGSGGSSAGAGGSSAGAGGSSAGAGGSSAGTGGASAGAGGSSAGAGGSSAGAGGSSAGAGGSSAGAGGAKTTSAMCGSIPILGQQGPSTTDECSACVETSCCAEGTACGAVADCAPYRSCIGPCATQACADACASMYPAGPTPSGAFTSCRNTKCAKPCQDFSCLGSVGPATPTSAVTSLVVAPTDFQTGKPLVGAVIKQCKRADTTCATPVDTQTTDANGSATFAAVPDGAAGYEDYFEITHASYLPTLVFDIASSAFEGTKFDPQVISTQTWTLLTGVVSVTPDSTRGHVAFLAATCKGARAVGVSVSADAADAMTTRVYIAGALPSKSATETDASGAGAFVNLPVGPVTLSG
ncbi:MAG: hypothetical protein IT374_27630, partial [Polyangiaceae bacterium]|nr:hypothetical protein [Polyangiaceae bacterium]